MAQEVYGSDLIEVRRFYLQHLFINCCVKTSECTFSCGKSLHGHTLNATNQEYWSNQYLRNKEYSSNAVLSMEMDPYIEDYNKHLFQAKWLAFSHQRRGMIAPRSVPKSFSEGRWRPSCLSGLQVGKEEGGKEEYWLLNTLRNCCWKPLNNTKNCIR